MSRFGISPLLPLLLFGLAHVPAAGAGTDPGVAGQVERVRELTRSGAYAGAESLGRAVLDEARRAFGPSSRRTLAALDAYVEVAGRGARATLPETRALAEEAARLHEQREGRSHPGAAASWVRLARPLIAGSRTDSAQVLLDRAVEVFRKCGARCRAPLANALLVQAALDFRRRDYAVELEHTREAVTILEALRPPDSLALALAYSALGRAHLALLDDAEAARWYEHAIPLLERTAGPGHREMGAAVNNLGILSRRQGDYVQARALFERSLELALRAEGSESPVVATCYDNLSWVRSALGDLAGARKDAQAALDLRERAHGPDHPLTIYSLLQLEDVLRTIGDFEPSLACARRAYEASRRDPGKDSLYVARAAAALGQELQELGRAAEARAHFEAALRLRRRGSGAQPEQVAWLLTQVGRTFADAGDHAEATGRFQEAARMQEALPHYFLSGTLGWLAASLAAAGRFEEARDLRARAYAIRDSVVGPRSQASLQALAELARAEYDLGHDREALDHALAAEEGARRQLRSMTGALSEREVLRYAEIRAGGLDLLNSMAARPGGLDADGRRRVFDALIRSRALVFDDLADRRRSLRTEDAETARLVAELQRARTELAERVVSLSRGNPSESQRQALRAAGLRREAAERAINERSARFRHDRAREEIGIAAVRAGLPPDAALVSFLRYHALEPRALVRQPGDRGRFVAWVTGASLDAPEAIPLGDATTIDSLALAWRAELGVPPSASPARARTQEARCAKLGESVRRAIWDPLQSRLGKARCVFVVPDGALQLVNLAALPGAHARYLVETGPLVHTLTTERDLVAPDSPGVRGIGLLAVGGPDFERASGERPGPGWQAQAVAPGTAAAASSPEAVRDRFAPLPAAGEEVVEVAKIWGEAAGSGAFSEDRARVVCLTGEAATENAVKQLAPGRRVLHIATHSFHLAAGSGAVPWAGTRGIGGIALSRPAAAVAANGLALSEMGLVLAGARDASRGGGADDGYLTVEELLSLDLRGVEWAVLSACETGVAAGDFIENVRGFHRALRTAGVSTVVMSLWPVADQPAREWMAALYRSRIGGGRSTAEAIRDASRAMLAARRGRGASTHPFEWAAFVGAGDWR